MADDADSRFLMVAVPALAWLGGRLARGAWPGYCRVSQRDFLARAPWRTPALTAWMLTATALSGVAPILTTRDGRPQAGSAAMAIPMTLLCQVGLEGVIGLRTDRAHPVVGATFSTFRLWQVRREAATRGPDDHLHHRLLVAQQTFWSANIAMLAVTVWGRTRRPRNAIRAGRPRPA